jgi:hypothetical protein
MSTLLKKIVENYTLHQQGTTSIAIVCIQSNKTLADYDLLK